MAKELNEKQKLFCKYFVSEDFFGNGVKSYCKAYGLDPNDFKEYNSAKTRAYELLTNVDILSCINEQLEEAGLNDNFVDKQLLFAIMQNADLSSKVKAISEYNKLKARITQKVDQNNSGELIVRYVDGVKPA
jgi:phage terminase small subunit